MKRYCLTLDLKDDPALIEKYKEHHAPENQWPGINRHIRATGVERMEIYLFGTRMCMFMEVHDDFTFERMDEMNRRDPETQKWENLMWDFQQAVPGAKPGEKWVFMEKIFELP
ncbi:L-rhamnose mutarotase [Salmonirosea aquatica]|uniref:L-rhamnose mutarotase n=1 Tax=Salmonirosea aquatica TaxID=2654236 RepID=A0A7C9FSW6_9BACT|nr:L-rhamnose mutarotase [Cytophagaceae bacterium SJW1-29]